MTNKLKRAAVYLRRNGVSSQIIAKALGLTRQQVAAYVAHDTMRAKR